MKIRGSKSKESFLHRKLQTSRLAGTIEDGCSQSHAIFSLFYAGRSTRRDEMWASQ
jgi:hypothetical protein